MLTIRFNRIGKRNKAQFRIVLQENTVAPGGRHVEILGSWDPHQKKGVFKNERITYWIGKGVSISDSVWNLLIKQGVIKEKKRVIKIKKKAEEKPTEPQVKSESEEVNQEKKKEETGSEENKIK